MMDEDVSVAEDKGGENCVYFRWNRTRLGVTVYAADDWLLVAG